MTKFFVLDTNVLLHNPNAIYSFAEHTVIIPFTVIEELDKFKTSSDKKGVHARQILRELDQLYKKGALKAGAKMKNGGMLRILFSPTQAPHPDLDWSRNDNHIVGIAWTLKKEGQHVFFISKDINARIKAEVLGVQSEDYEKQLVEYDQLYKGWREVTVTDAEIDTLYKERKVATKLTLHENEYALLKGETKTALSQYEGEKKMFFLVNGDLEAMGLRPLNLEQRFAFDLLLNDDIKLVTLVGQAGTGKTLLALACALQKVIGRNPRYQKLLVARPIVPLGKDIGYLPGTKDQKLNFWMQPVFDNLGFLLQKEEGERGFGKAKDRIEALMDADLLEIEAITYIRGRSIPNQFIIIDEAQNLTPHEIKTIVSRAGKGTKIVLTGDPEQIDTPYLDANSNGLTYTAERLKGQRLVGHMLLSKSERSEIATLAAELL
jgi:PhoH-like ATPase